MKLLFILLLGLGFSQTKLETRVYEFDFSLSTGQSLAFDLFNITNGELSNNQNAIFQIMGTEIFWIGNFQNATAGITFRLKTSEYTFPLCQFYGDGGENGDTPYSKNYTYMNYVSGTGQEWIVEGGSVYSKVLLAITAEFPQEDTGYIEEGFQFCLHSGANLVSFPCDNPVSVATSLPNGIENFVSTIIGEGQATSYTSNGWIGNLNNFTPGSGYWFKSNSDVCFEYECVES